MKLQNKLKKPRKVKGMTLIECIIALLVVGITGLMMAQIVTTCCNIMRDTTHLNNKVTAESPYVSGRNVDQLNQLAEDNALPTDPGADISITVRSGSATDNQITGKRYSTKSAADASDRDTTSNMSGNLEFYTLDPHPTEATT